MGKYSINPVGHRFDGRRREGDGGRDAVDEPREDLQPHGPLREGVREPRRADTSTPRTPLLPYTRQRHTLCMRHSDLQIT